MLDVDRERGLLDLIDARRSEELSEVALSRPRQPRLVRYARIECPCRIPEQTQRALAAGVIPDTRGDRATRAGDPGHLAKPRDGVGHEMDDELRQRSVEHLIGKRQLLSGSALD